MSESPSTTPGTEPAADYSTGPSPESAAEAELALRARVEALLFVSAGPTDVSRLASALDVAPKEIDRALDDLKRDLVDRGLRLQVHRGGYQLTSAPQAASDIERLLNLETTSRLTRAALEILAIIAYEQPVTRPHIDSIRGVNSESALQTLLRHGLVEETGRSEGPGRPILYATTADFLQHFGLGSLEQMPPLAPSEMPGESAAEVAAQPAEGA